MREDLPGKFFKLTPIKIIRKLSDDTKKLLTEEVNKSVEHNLNSNFKVITKRIHDLKVLEKQLVDAAEDTDEIALIFQ